MAENNDRINQLFSKLDDLLKKHDTFSREINELREEINRLSFQISQQVNETENPKSETPLTEIIPEVKKEPVTPTYQVPQQQVYKEQTAYSAEKRTYSPPEKSNIEKFIGENLINKIGIVITVIGVAIGAKYSIDHQLISPLTRIILGYIFALGLVGFGIKLKKNYTNYSAVLVSGAIAILYFITFFAYSFYNLMPQAMAFVLMLVFTAFTIIAAISYNKQVIAHIGLVGAYAVPFLLSSGSGRADILFSYIAIINIGILIIAFKKYWKPLYYSSFILTWLIFSVWYVSSYQSAQHVSLALIFLVIYFVTFYLIFLAYKLLQKEKFEAGDIVLLLANSFIFFGLGYSILNTTKTGEQLLGLFTLCNAIIHFVVSTIMYKQKLADRNLFFLVIGLVLVFITIAIPVQLNSHWVTLLWVFEATLLFWIGRTKNVPIYEWLSYPLMLLACLSIIHDWQTVYNVYVAAKPETRITPIFNINFLTSALFISSFAFINYIHNKKKYESSQPSSYEVNTLLSFFVPAILLTVLYFSIRMEISTYWNQLITDSTVIIEKNDQSYTSSLWNYDLSKFKITWIIIYTLLFFSVLAFVNLKKIKNRILGFITLGFGAISIVVFLTQGLYLLSELRDSYLTQTLAEYYIKSSFYIGIRYIALACVGLMLTCMYYIINQEFIKPVSFKLKVTFDMFLHTSLVWIASSELINWMNLLNFSQSYKLGLSILWGLYALMLIVLGIWKKKKHLRIGAIVLFAVTLIKLFFYDISHLETIAKTVVFVSLGILLLIISFLYNKFKHIISDADEK